MDWRHLPFAEAVVQLRETFGFDFTSIGLAPQLGSALQWVHTSGATSDRHKRIELSPGHGIGGIVLKTGKPMRFTNIDSQLGPRSYSSFPIVFAEDLRSLIALPLRKGFAVVGVMLCAFRTSRPSHAAAFDRCIEEVRPGICGFDVVTEGFLSFEELAGDRGETPNENATAPLLSLVEAREEERRAISRELHDGLAQELLSISMMVKQIALIHDDEPTRSLTSQAECSINRMLDETRNLSVQLRPLALDDLGLGAALRVQANVYAKMFGPRISIDDSTERKRYDRNVETQVYRIAQESLLNACKYANSDAIDVIVADDGSTLTVAVCDQGCGFDTDELPILGHGCGLGSMRERASIIGANLNVYSSEAGTTVTLSVPLS